MPLMSGANRAIVMLQRQQRQQLLFCLGLSQRGSVGQALVLVSNLSSNCNVYTGMLVHTKTPSPDKGAKMRGQHPLHQRAPDLVWGGHALQQNVSD